MLGMISGWNEAGRWLDSSVHRFKFRPDQTRSFGPRGQPARTITDHIIISPYLHGTETREGSGEAVRKGACGCLVTWSGRRGPRLASPSCLLAARYSLTPIQPRWLTYSQSLCRQRSDSNLRSTSSDGHEALMQILVPRGGSTPDSPKVEVMTPDVTNQADKERGLLWADAQLWAQLCRACQANSLAQKWRRREALMLLQTNHTTGALLCARRAPGHR
ncbi:unnamed protein product [Pleuronectes platessa]|uniref:Uncharacterized protein n=1 Tax=Pleuronectes platessa TaxID=8262 RepID=A0A9N7THV4_PLEPL|nr:unnamed protein product [Pleuronectes platessa]